MTLLGVCLIPGFFLVDWQETGRTGPFVLLARFPGLGPFRPGVRVVLIFGGGFVAQQFLAAANVVVLPRPLLLAYTYAFYLMAFPVVAPMVSRRFLVAAFAAIATGYGLLGFGAPASQARTLLSQVRDGDLTGRLGGEEFALALPGALAHEALEVAERIREEPSGGRPSPRIAE
jgi:hypothetical protein